MYEGEDVNTIDLLYEESTTESNGVKVIIPVKYGDRWNFQRKIKEQLCYFENVYFDVPEDSSINNEFIISRHEHFQFSELSTDPMLHICLDNVYYPLDFNKLGIKSIHFPVGLRFSLTDGLYPTPNRESLRYTAEAKQIILDKLKTVANYFVEKYNAGIDSGTDVKSFINSIEKNSKLIQLGNGAMKDITCFMEFSTVKVSTPKIDGINTLDIHFIYKYGSHLILSEFTQKFQLRNKRMMDVSKGYGWGFTPREIAAGNVKVYVYADKVSQIKKDYLRATENPNTYVNLVKRNNHRKLGNYSKKHDPNSYYNLLNLATVPKDQWRKRIEEFQHFTSLLTQDFIDLDALEIPQEFINGRKKAKTVISSTGAILARKLKVKGEIVCKKAVPLSRYSSSKSCKFDSTIYKLEDLHKSKHLKIYAPHADQDKLDALYDIVAKQKIELISFSDRELKIVNDLEVHNLISYDKFMEGKDGPYRRIVTSYLIQKLISKYRPVFDKSQMIGYVSTDLKEKLDALSDYENKNYVNSSSTRLIDEMLIVAEQHKLFDQTIYPEYLEMTEILSKLSFLNPLFSRMGYFHKEDEVVDVVVDLFKYYKHKVNLEHYKIRMNDEILTEETVEELLD
jgi:hypothetical protein